MKRRTRLTHLTLAVPLAFSLVLTACGGSDSASNQGEGESKTSGKPTEITTAIMNYEADMVGEDNVVWKELEKRTNTKLKITWIPEASFDEKLNVMLASGDLPELTYVESIDTPQIRSLISQGVFWDLTPFIKDYPNMNKLPKETWSNSKIDGKQYVIPRYYPIVGGGLFPILRQDWLDKLGLKTPESLDDLYQVLKAFTEGDPDGNGNKDTIGMAGYLGSFNFIFNVMNETGGAWKLRDGSIYPLITEDKSREALLYVKKLYDEGLISPDLAILKLNQVLEAVKGNKAGAASLSMAYSWEVTGELRKTLPNAEFRALPYLKSTNDVKYVPATGGFYGAYLIPKKVSESKVKSILKFLDYGYSQEVNDLANYGIKGVHYNEENGRKISTEQANKDLVKVGGNLGSIWRPLGFAQVIDSVGIANDVYEQNKKTIDERLKSYLKDPALGVVSDAYNKFWPDIDKKVTDFRVKVILGQESIDAYDQLIAKIKEDANYKKVVEEMNAAYKQRVAENGLGE
ncbi:extracellular solute-binding protein [Paenibacillus sp. HJL G12]|uniref:Extracellular solute-binding protein n=1 Tax=Paenibacillus dendrobii TaxID=2691084 RepID=A0A7X3INH7_9BACL|nr:extracellular solute-binding protein [Paenibacillus dendrobii]MWV47169.1 extracellular solute-binding protein [Paenibacillus dendrobii]